MPFPPFAPRRQPPRGLTAERLILLVALFVTATGNLAFFRQVLAVYPPEAHRLPALASLALALLAVNVLLPALLGVGRALKPVLVALLLVSAAASGFMDVYGVVIDADMLRNAAQTQAAEVADLLSPRMLAYWLLLGLLPAVLVVRAPVTRRGWRAGTLARLGLLGLALLVLTAATLPFGAFYASFIREHKPLRSHANPAYPLYAALRYARGEKRTAAPAPHGTDAARPAADDHRELVILVVGETARADHFSLNGYDRETNPEMRRAEAISFTDFHACGTSTAVSVPCMFDDRVNPAGGHRENVLDVLQRAGVHVLWRDNNSDSKGVALRVPYENYRDPAINPVCDGECRDEGMLAGLQEYIDSRPGGDILIVLHQMGNHGPAYHRRYPPAFERFTPVCRSSDLSQCGRAEIVNAYDNALLYTDHFLGRVVALLARNSPRFEAAMFYLSDHGESLGENGVYLHGMPRALAPEAQLHVPALLWFPPGFDDVDPAAVRARRQRPYTHDHLFHTLLGFFEVETAVYRRDMDMLGDLRAAGAH